MRLPHSTGPGCGPLAGVYNGRALAPSHRARIPSLVAVGVRVLPAAPHRTAAPRHAASGGWWVVHLSYGTVVESIAAVCNRQHATCNRQHATCDTQRATGDAPERAPLPLRRTLAERAGGRVQAADVEAVALDTMRGVYERRLRVHSADCASCEVAHCTHDCINCINEIVTRHVAWETLSLLRRASIRLVPANRDSMARR